MKHSYKTVDIRCRPFGHPVIILLRFRSFVVLEKITIKILLSHFNIIITHRIAKRELKVIDRE